jgi:2,3-bisphosphoglycerate-dependent phosphoglycerate mutase
MARLVMVRHGQSQWNLENRFTGWVDVPLSTQGINEAISAGQQLKDIRFDTIFVSHMLRAIQTLHYILLELSDDRTPIFYHEDTRIHNWEKHTGDSSKELAVYQYVDLAERFYGNLQGLNKDETREKYGAEQVHLWRRSYDINPPEGESLKNTAERTIPCYKKHVLPHLQDNETILIVAHGNSLRSIVMFIEQISEEDIPHLEIPTGIPLVYDFDSAMNLENKTQLQIH